MSCSVIIKDLSRCERAMCVDSEEELRSMTVEEFSRRVCPEDKSDRYTLYYAHKILEDDCGIKHESPIDGFECRRCGVHGYRLSFTDEILEDGRTLADYGIREGCTILELKEYLSGSAGCLPSKESQPLPEDDDIGIPKSQSMEQLLIDMEQPEPSE